MVEVLHFNGVIALLQGSLSGHFARCMEAVIVYHYLCVDLEHAAIVRTHEEGVDAVFRDVDVAFVCQADDR